MKPFLHESGLKSNVYDLLLLMQLNLPDTFPFTYPALTQHCFPATSRNSLHSSLFLRMSDNFLKACDMVSSDYSSLLLDGSLDYRFTNPPPIAPSNLLIATFLAYSAELSYMKEYFEAMHDCRSYSAFFNFCSLSSWPINSSVYPTSIHEFFFPLSSFLLVSDIFSVIALSSPIRLKSLRLTKLNS